MANTKRMNRLEEMGRLDSEKAYTSKGKKNLAAEKKRVIGELKKPKKMAAGGRIASKGEHSVQTKAKRGAQMVKMNGSTGMKAGGMAKMRKGGKC